MKKITLLLAILATFTFANASSKADLFNVDFQEIEQELSELNTIEQVVLNSETDISFEELNSTSPELFSHVSLDINSPLQPNFSIDEMDWGAFAWGFCCCPIGFFVVAINNDKTSDQKLSYWIGVIVNTGLSIISNVIYVATVGVATI